MIVIIVLQLFIQFVILYLCNKALNNNDKAINIIKNDLNSIYKIVRSQYDIDDKIEWSMIKDDCFIADYNNIIIQKIKCENGNIHVYIDTMIKLTNLTSEEVDILVPKITKIVSEFKTNTKGEYS